MSSIPLNIPDDKKAGGPIRAYGDHLDDGLTQVNFTLPLPNTKKARQAALILAAKMGLEHTEVAHSESLNPGYTHFIIYGKNIHSVELSMLTWEDDLQETMSQADIEAFIETNIKRNIVVIGASTGTDTHTIGIDAILNSKGFGGSSGLESYRGFQIYNLGGQVPNETLVARARELNADVILVSQTVTQQNLHVYNMTHLVDLLEADNLRDQALLICGGFQITDELAKELGFDRGFSRGTHPNHVATYIVREMAERKTAYSDKGI
jgi:beta-lysine 5,6-aminomutase beta subunit